MLFRVNMSAILLRHECISIIKFMTVLFLLSCILLTALQHVPKSPEYITTTGYNTVGKVPQKIAGPAVALLSPCISHCHQGDTLQGHHCPQLRGCDPHHNNHSGMSPFLQTVLLPVPLYYYFYYPNLQLTIRGKTSVIQLQYASLLPAVMSEQCGWQGMVPECNMLLCRVQEGGKNQDLWISPVSSC